MNEIGGNKILFQDKGIKIFLDFGMSFYDLGELVEIKPEPNSCYILSASEPFSEEMGIDFERLVNWLGHNGMPQYHTHVSGHIIPLHLESVLREMGAGKIFPIHTEHANLFAKFIRDMRSEVVVVETNREYKI